MNVFDPSKSMNAFAAGAQIGGAMRQGETNRKLAPMVASNDYDGAMKYAASRGDMAAMDYLRPMQEKAQGEAYNKELGALMAAGNTKGAMANAFAAGKLDQGISLYNYDRALRADEITDYKSGIDYLVSNAERLKGLAPEQRGEEAMRIIQSSPWGQDQRVMAAVQQAAADGRLTDEEIDGFNMQLLSAGERLAQQNWQAGFQRDADWRAEDQDYRADRDAVTDQQWQAGHNLATSKFGWEKEQAAAEANAPTMPEFGDTWKMRSDFEKQARGFEEAQRQYFMMGDLARDATGASDIALGFAFFKTIDPTSTVREGEFAAAASAMGLNAALVQQFARLDKGEKFSPQLRQDLLQAAGHAYNQQAQDIQALYEREGQFAASMGVDPRLIVRDPVRPREAPVDGVTLPSVGSEEDGYVFLGGDPADPNNWKLKEAGSDFRFFNSQGER